MLVAASAWVSAGASEAEAATPMGTAVTAPVATIGATVPALPPPAPLPTVSVPSPPTPGSVAAEAAALAERVVGTVTPREPKPPREKPTTGGEGSTNAGSTSGGSARGRAAARDPSRASAAPRRTPRPARALPAGRSGTRRERGGGAPTRARSARGRATRTRPPSPPARAADSGRRRRAGTRGSPNPLDVIGRAAIPLPVPDWSKPIILLLAVIAIAFGFRWAVTSRRARGLQREQAVLSEDVWALQAALVPAAPAGLDGVDVSVAYRPADGPGAGGDFYDVFELAPGRLAMILGDVAGHGRGALRDAALTRYTVRAYLQAGMSPRAALALAGTTLSPAGSELMATVAVAIFDAETGALTYALAGHPPPIVTGIDLPEPLHVCCSAPLGSHLPTGRRQTTVSLPAGASACFYTDGLTEARCSSGEKLLGRQRLRNLLESLEGPSDAVRLLDAVRRAADATPDDMAACILTSRALTDGAPRSHAEELELDRLDLAGDRLPKFLAATGVAAEAIEVPIRAALDTIGRHGSALMRVLNDGRAVTVWVTAPEAEPTAQLVSPLAESGGTESPLAEVGA